jgi:hypothetical protein
MTAHANRDKDQVLSAVIAHGIPVEPGRPRSHNAGHLPHLECRNPRNSSNRSHHMSLYSSRIQYHCAESTHRPRLQCSMPIAFSTPVCNHGCAFQLLHVMTGAHMII